MLTKMVAWFLFAGLSCSIYSFIRPPLPAGRAKLRTIIIDPGHGGIDPGTHGLISKEKDVTLEIGLKLGEAIQKEMPGVKVLYTRTTDLLPGNLDNIHESLRVRAETANKAKGDLFISIHCDATPQPAGGWYAKRVIGHKSVYKYTGRGSHRKKRWVKEPIYEAYWVKNTRIGASTYIWAADRSGSKSSFIGEKNVDGQDSDFEASQDSSFMPDMNSPEARMQAELYEKKFFDNSFLLASMVQEQFKNNGRIDLGVLQRTWAGIWVLQATGMPSILIETGYLTNKEEEEYLNSDKGQADIVQEIVDALKQYKDSIEGAHSELSNTPAGS